jgi:hypothetical protein
VSEVRFDRTKSKLTNLLHPEFRVRVTKDSPSAIQKLATHAISDDSEMKTTDAINGIGPIENFVLEIQIVTFVYGVHLFVYRF